MFFGPKIVKCLFVATALALPVLNLLLPSDAMAAKPSGKAWKSGPWKGRIYVHNESGAFSHCQMYGVYGAHILVFSVGRRYNFRIGLSNKTWNIPTTQRYNLAISIDGLFLGSHPAKPLNSRTIVVRPKTNAKLIFKKIQNGNVLRIRAKKQTFKFKLTGTKRALNRLLRCVKVAKGGDGGHRNPFGGGDGKQRANPFGGNDNRQNQGETGKQNWGRPSDQTVPPSDGLKIARSLIRRIDDRRYRLLLPPPEKLRRLKANAVWKSPGGYGAIHTLKRRYGMAFLKNKLETAQRKNCLGNFHTAAQMRYIGGKSKSPIIKIACRRSKSGKPYFINFAFYRKKGGGSYRIMHVSADPDGANEADRTMFREIEKILVARHSK